MTGLRWVRLDATFPTNPKVLALTEAGRWRAITVYLCGLAYCGGQGTDGFIPTGALPHLHARKTDAQHLVDAGLWDPEPGGWQIHGWLEYQPSSGDTAARSARARAAAQARWNRPVTHLKQGT